GRRHHRGRPRLARNLECRRQPDPEQGRQPMKIDPVTQEILDSALRSISEEMAVVEYRSSFSPVIREMLDYNCAIFDQHGRVVAHSETIPALLGVMQFALAHILENHDGPLEDGDVVLLNHPYRGGTHTPDLQVFRPVY